MDWLLDRIVPVIIVLAFCAMPVLGYLAWVHRNDYSDACEAKGGQVNHVDTSGYKYVNGKWGWAYDGFDQCLTPDGRVIVID